MLTFLRKTFYRIRALLKKDDLPSKEEIRFALSVNKKRISIRIKLAMEGYLNGQSIAEIAKKNNCSENDIKKLIRYGCE